MSEPPKLLDRVRTAIRARQYSTRTEEAYVAWIRRYILFHAQGPARLPVVLSVDEARQVIEQMDGVCRLVAQLLYGAGLHLLEALTLRVKDLDFERGQITIRDPKWKRARLTMLPRLVTPALHEQLTEAPLTHELDLAEGSAPYGCPMQSPGSSPRHRATGAGEAIRRRIDEKSGGRLMNLPPP